MNFDYSEEQRLLQESVERLVREEYGFASRQRIVATAEGHSAAHWSLFAELGWLALPLPESAGGLGGGVIESAILMEAFGRGLVPSPWLACVVLGGGAIAALGTPAQRERWLPPLIAGELHLALAHYETASRYEPSAIASRARREGNGWVLEGGKCVVLNAPQADLVLLSAREEDGGIGLFAVAPGTPGLRLEAYRTIDGAPAAELAFEGLHLAAEARLGTGDALPTIRTLLDRAALLVSAEALGAMDVLLERTVAYAKTRKQFGVPIGSFQALQHRMADMFIEREQSRSILLMALLSAESGGEDAARAISAAKHRIGRAARRIGQEAIQLHGGIGVTDALDVGHYVKRLTAIEALFGNQDWHLRRFGGIP